ncbi:ORF6N domain-containing protein [Desulfonema magnum]|uniref:DNA-binding domain-containing protein, KilA-N-like n=1 Tax=Desulfonema magnum TaxID=45655 RepID=A0A975BXZ2_9BACT|nr:ORF6N domain-containing protein [Desulfonema magnum]QTA93572.1 DNA-binding domain-containing protein, KilA-N-like [Desulfonema magnum]
MKELTVKEIQSQIISLPGRPPAMLDRDLADIYGTETKRINEAAKRNPDRFPNDFRFQLTRAEMEILRSQNATFQWLQGVKYLPWAYTREGCNMMSACLETPVAVNRSVFIMRAFSAMEAGQRSQAHMKSSEQTVGDLFDRSARRFITALEVAKLAGITDEHEARRTANRITKETTGFDLLKFVRPGYVPVSETVRQEEEALITFLNIWWEKYGEEAVDSHYLRLMIIDNDISFDLGGGNQRSQKIRLSRTLGKMKGRQISGYHITEAGIYRNSKLWKLRPAAKQQAGLT